MKYWKKLKAELLKNPAVRQEYDDLAPKYKLAQNLLKARLAKKMTQSDLAKQAGVSQVIIARLESGNGNPTVATINRVASALGKEIKLVASR
ncbi:MAG: helix-turn-helix domain-containing protein [Candidatus Saccharimonadales bacterium]